MYSSVPSRHRRGYRLPPHLRSLVAEAHRTRPRRSVAAAMGDQLGIVAAAAGSAIVAVVGGPVATVLAVLVAACLIGRFARGLENLVHEGSHLSWDRRRHAVNDVLVRLLACWPTGASLRAYRASHLRHHGRFGTEDDPDRLRYEQLGVEDWDRTTVRGLVRDVLPRWWPYCRGWWAEASGSGAAVVGPVVWALVVLVLPAALTGGAAAVAIVVVTWVLGIGLALPTLRMVAECSEHRFRGTETVVEATISNLGRWQRLLIHPHGDGFHTVHHLWPGVPHHRVARLHRALVAGDATFAAAVRVRHGVLRAPVTGVRG